MRHTRRRSIFYKKNAPHAKEKLKKRPWAPLRAPFGCAWGAPGCSLAHLGRSWKPSLFLIIFLIDFWPNLAPFWEPKWHQNGGQNGPKTKTNNKMQKIPLHDPLGTVFDRFWCAQTSKKHRVPPGNGKNTCFVFFRSPAARVVFGPVEPAQNRSEPTFLDVSAFSVLSPYSASPRPSPCPMGSAQGPFAIYLLTDGISTAWPLLVALIPSNPLACPPRH